MLLTLKLVIQAEMLVGDLEGHLQEIEDFIAERREEDAARRELGIEDSRDS